MKHHPVTDFIMTTDGVEKDTQVVNYGQRAFDSADGDALRMIKLCLQ